MTRLVVVDATPLGPEPSGARRRLESLLGCLAARLPDDVFEVHWARDGGGASPALADAGNVIHAVIDVSCRGGAWRWWRRSRELERRHTIARFTHLLVDHGPIVLRPGLRTIVTLHDLRFLHGYGGRARRLYGRFLYGWRLRKAAAVVAVSPSVAEEAQAAWRLSPAQVLVAPNAPSEPFAPDPRLGRRHEVLVVARDEPRKARGAARVAAEAAGWPLRVLEGKASEEDLVEAYRRASWLLAPSVLEGFDLPVVEALACGTPVIASDIPAHRDLEAAGARGLVRVPPPERKGGQWAWPAAARRLSMPPPDEVAPPPATWDASAQVVARTLVG